MIAAFLAAPLLFIFTAYASISGVLFGLSLYVMSNGLFCSALFYFLYLQLPAKYRCRGVSTVWALSASLGAITLPLAEQANLHQMAWLAPCWVSVMAFIGYLRLSQDHCREPKGIYLSAN